MLFKDHLPYLSKCDLASTVTEYEDSIMRERQKGKGLLIDSGTQ